MRLREFPVWRYAPMAVLLLISVQAAPLPAYEITPKGHELGRFFDSLDVQRHWLAGMHVNWRSGDRDSDRQSATHCSAFVASAAERLGVYILRPPQHTIVLLANAQFAWLHNEGRKYGWQPVRSPLDAQRLANEGRLVVATYHNGDPKKPGHIAFVRPSTKSTAMIETEGPQIIQAGGSNYNSASLKAGFGHHRDAWSNGTHYAVRFYEHPVDFAAGVPVARRPARTPAAVR